MKKALLVTALLVIPSAAHAQFGLAQVVYLARMAALDALIYGSTSATAAKAATIAETAIHQMQLAQQMAQTIDSFKYRGLQSLIWQSPYLLNADRYGLAGPWLQAVSGMQPAAIAYQQATIPVPMGDAPAYYASASPAQQQRIGVEYAWLQDVDAANAAALQVIGDSNATIVPAQIAVNNLVEDSFTSGFMDDPQSSMRALAQKQNIAGGMALQLQQQSIEIQKNVLHELVLINTRARNEQAAKLNADAAIHQQQVQAVQGVQGLSAALNSFRY